MTGLRTGGSPMMTSFEARSANSVLTNRSLISYPVKVPFSSNSKETIALSFNSSYLILLLQMPKQRYQDELFRSPMLLNPCWSYRSWW